MKHITKIIIAILVYAFLIAIGDWAGGSNTKDEWDNLMKWTRKSK